MIVFWLGCSVIGGTQLTVFWIYMFVSEHYRTIIRWLARHSYNVVAEKHFHSTTSIPVTAMYRKVLIYTVIGNFFCLINWHYFCGNYIILTAATILSISSALPNPTFYFNLINFNDLCGKLLENRLCL